MEFYIWQLLLPIRLSEEISELQQHQESNVPSLPGQITVNDIQSWSKLLEHSILKADVEVILSSPRGKKDKSSEMEVEDVHEEDGEALEEIEDASLKTSLQSESSERREKESFSDDADEPIKKIRVKERPQTQFKNTVHNMEAEAEEEEEEFQTNALNEKSQELKEPPKKKVKKSPIQENQNQLKLLLSYFETEGGSKHQQNLEPLKDFLIWQIENSKNEQNP